MEDSTTTSGILYIVATPIGNLEDLSFRAIKVLKKVDIILAEDTRHSLILLQHLGIKKPLSSLHAHNEEQKSKLMLKTLQEGKSIALISDAGTPVISDPGLTLVQLAHQQGFQVVPIPGPCSLITALSAAGIACDRFTFAGFLPAKSKARKDTLKALSQWPNTLIFFESSHRILACLDDIIEIFGKEYSLVLAKELTKTFERFIRGSAEKIKTWLMEENSHTKGEFVCMLPKKLGIKESDCHDKFILSTLLQELSYREAIKLAALLTKKPKNKLYQLAMELKNERGSS